MLRHFDQEERQIDRSRHWDSIKPELVRKFACEGARDFSDEAWLQEIFEGSTKRTIEYCKDKDGIVWVFATQGILVVFQSSQNWWVMYLFLEIGKSTYFIGSLSSNFQSVLGNGLIPGGKESFWKWPRGGRASWWLHSSTECALLVNGNTTKMPYAGYDYQRRRIKDWNSGRRSHLQSWLTLQYLETALIV